MERSLQGKLLVRQAAVILLQEPGCRKLIGCESIQKPGSRLQKRPPRSLRLLQFAGKAPVQNGTTGNGQPNRIGFRNDQPSGKRQNGRVRITVIWHGTVATVAGK
ncbi:MAG TPA: hypothetical protein PLI65_01100 [Bacteroidales bacterium]|nr:hypothetical protein [Bacteroidales bacterium]HRW96168.1 hypothetical protein [Bacteroidales bacterium]